MCSKIGNMQKVQQTPVGNQRGIRRPAPYPERRRCRLFFFLPAPARSLSLLESVRWADAVVKPHAGSIDGNASREAGREVVMWWLLGCIWRCSVTKNWGLFASVLIFLRRRRRSRLCGGPSKVALRLLRWFYLSQWWLLASEAADATAQIALTGACLFHL